MKRYTLEEKTWLRTNYSLLGSKACAEFLNRSISSVRQTANKLGCKIPQLLRNKLHSETLINSFIPTILPEVFSNVNTKEAAYVLGILWADGWIQNKQDYSINIKLIEEDFREILPAFFAIGEWKQYYFTPKQRKPTIQLRASGKSLVDILIALKYDVKSGHSAQMIIDSIPIHLQKFWWRGYFDGDGHIRSTHPYRLEFSSAYNQDWNFLPPKFQIYRHNGIHSYSKARLCKKSDIIEFGHHIWDNWDNIGLSRKYKIFQKFLYHTHSRT